MDTQILIAGGQTILREAIASLLNTELGITVIGQAENGRAAVQLTRELKPDMILMDIEMPNLNGIEATRQIIRESPDIKILMLSANLDSRNVFESIKAGAVGYLSKNSGYKELVSAIEKIAKGQIYLNPDVSKIVLGEYKNPSKQKKDDAYNLLTDREREILQLVAEGKPTKVIAKELFISVKTVEWHRGRIMNKLDTNSVAELVKYAIREGLTTVNA